MPSSSLVEIEVKVGVEVEVGDEVEVEDGVGVEVGVEVDATLNFRHSLDGVQILFRWLGGWGWLEKWGLKLISTQVVVEVEVGVELGKNHKEKF